MAADPADDWQNERYLVQTFMAANDIKTCWSFLVLLKTVEVCPKLLYFKVRQTNQEG